MPLPPPAGPAGNLPPARRTTLPGTDHLYWIDWVRFLAAMAVVVNHTREFNWDWPSTLQGTPSATMIVFLALTKLGRPAVIVFFVLSGMLVGGKTIARVRRGTFDAVDYTADRLARIYVPLVPALLLTAAVVRGYDMPSYAKNYLVCLTGLQDVWINKPFFNAPLWSLAYEVWFYVLAGCAAVACARGASPWKRAAAGGGAAVALGMFLKLYVVFLLCWLLGAAGFWLRERVRSAPRWWAAAGAAAAAGGVAFYHLNSGLLPTPGFLSALLPPSAAADLLLAAGAVVLIASLSRMAPAAGAGAGIERMGTRLAAFSYTLYLTHCPTLWFLLLPTTKAPLAFTGPSIARGCVWLAACIAVALGMYALFETRTPSVRRWLRARLAGPWFHPAPVLAAGA